MANTKAIIIRDLPGGYLHDITRNGDTIVDEADNELFVLSVTSRLNLPEYNNLSPQDGDVWKYNNVLWARLNGVTRRILTYP